MNQFGEPWTADHGVLLDRFGKRIPEYCEDALTPEQAIRVAACVNFCRHYPNDVLEGKVLFGPATVDGAERYLILVDDGT